MKTTALIPAMRSLSNGRGEWDVLRSTLDSLESTFFSDPFFDDFFALRSGRSARFPKIDVWETETAYEIEANVAGLNKDEVTVELGDNCVVLSGEKKERKNENGKYLVSELSYKKFYRQIPIPGMINQDAVEAKHDNGILRIVLPKIMEAKPSSKKIEIK